MATRSASTTPLSTSFSSSPTLSEFFFAILFFRYSSCCLLLLSVFPVKFLFLPFDLLIVVVNTRERFPRMRAFSRRPCALSCSQRRLNSPIFTVFVEGEAAARSTQSAASSRISPPFPCEYASLCRHPPATFSSAARSATTVKSLWTSAH